MANFFFPVDLTIHVSPPLERDEDVVMGDVFPTHPDAMDVDSSSFVIPALPPVHVVDSPAVTRLVHALAEPMVMTPSPASLPPIHTVTLAASMIVDLDNGSRRHAIFHPRLHDYRQRNIDEDDEDQLVEGGRDAAVDRRSPTQLQVDMLHDDAQVKVDDHQIDTLTGIFGLLDINCNAEKVDYFDDPELPCPCPSIPSLIPSTYATVVPDAIDHDIPASFSFNIVSDLQSPFDHKRFTYLSALDEYMPLDDLLSDGKNQRFKDWLLCRFASFGERLKSRKEMRKEKEGSPSVETPCRGTKRTRKEHPYRSVFTPLPSTDHRLSTNRDPFGKY
jgi:hypothetical protein